MLDQTFNSVYTKFKLHFYKAVFSRFQDREASLTTVETFCMEIIMALGRPTINEFARFVNISPPNAAYKVNSLIQKEFRSCRIDLHLKFKVLLPILCAVIDIDHGQTDALYPGVVNAVEVDVVIILIRFHMNACKNGIHMEPTGDIEGNGVIIHPLRILQP